MKFTFTQAALTKFFAANPRALAWDETQRNLGAYARSDGGVTLFCQFRVHERQRKKVLGHLSELSLAQARTMTAEYAISGRHGKDVLEEQRKAGRSALTLQDAYDAHRQSLIRRGASPLTLALNETNWRLRLAKHGSKSLASLTRSELREWHDGGKSDGVSCANKTAKALRTMLNYAIRKLDADIQLNPAVSIEFFKERGHRPVIAPDDLAAFWAAAGRIDNRVCRGFWKVAILTGLRRNDILTMRWVDVHEDRIHIPFPKMRKPFDVPMTDALRGVLQELREHHAVMWPRSAASKSGHLRSPYQSLKGYSPHSCRRSYASACARVLRNPYLVKSLLNHAVSEITELYVQVGWDEKREAAEAVAAWLMTKLVGEPCRLLEFQGDASIAL